MLIKGATGVCILSIDEMAAFHNNFLSISKDTIEWSDWFIYFDHRKHVAGLFKMGMRLNGYEKSLVVSQM